MDNCSRSVVLGVLGQNFCLFSSGSVLYNTIAHIFISSIKRKGMQSKGEILQRYGRQMLLPIIGNNGQEKIMNCKVLIVGAGGIGSTVALYLASSGVTLGIIDHDVVDRSNLHRQIIHQEINEGKNKAVSAIERLLSINSSLNHLAIQESLSTENAIRVIADYDLVVDATDNFEARYIINDACVLLGKPFISGSAVGMEGQITVISPKQTACFRCLYPSPSIAEMCRSCANAGVLGPVPGMIGCWEAIEALKLIVKKGDNQTSSLSNLLGRQLLFDCANAETFGFDLPPRDPACAVCSENPTILSLADTEKTLLEYRQLAEHEAKCYLGGELDVAHSMVASRYYEEYLRKDKKHIILDVRSKVQFGMSSFGVLDSVCTTASLSQICEVDFSKYTAAVVNLPLSQLRTELTSNINNITKSLTVTPDGCSIMEIIVVCRRGIDSVVATRLLRETGLQSVFNLTGGLTAWKRDVQPSFPMY